MKKKYYLCRGFMAPLNKAKGNDAPCGDMRNGMAAMKLR